MGNDWVWSGFNHMNRHGVCHMRDRKPLRLKQFFAMARINVCFNVSFLDFNQYCKLKKVILGIKCKFFPKS